MLIKITQNIKVLFLTNIFLMSLHLYLLKKFSYCYPLYKILNTNINYNMCWDMNIFFITNCSEVTTEESMITDKLINICAFKGWIIGCDFFHLICNWRAQVHVSRSIVWMTSHYDFSGDFQLVKPIQYYCYMQKVIMTSQFSPERRLKIGL